MEFNLTVGIRCKACDRALGGGELDTELCNICMEVVNDCNKDLHKDIVEDVDEFTGEISP